MYKFFIFIIKMWNPEIWGLTPENKEESNEVPANAIDFSQTLNEFWDKKEFWWIVLSKDWIYEVPWINQEKNLKNNYKDKVFSGVRFADCRLSSKLWSVVFWWIEGRGALTCPINWKSRYERHKETFYSQKVKPWWALQIPWRHIANDNTIRDWDWYIVVAACKSYLPKWSTVMTTLWPGKVYDSWGPEMEGKPWIDIYTNW